jgi:hypothetical protein
MFAPSRIWCRFIIPFLNFSVRLFTEKRATQAS